MSKYTGASDPTRSTKTEWDEEEYSAVLKKISTIPFSSLDEGVPPHAPSGTLAPTVTQALHMLFFCLNLGTDRVFLLPQTINILLGTLPPFDKDLPKEYQEVRKVAVIGPPDGDDKEVVQSGGDIGEVDTTLPGRTHSQKWQTLKEAGQAVSSDNGEEDFDAGLPPWRAQSPSQEKVKYDKMAKARWLLSFAGTARLVRNMGQEMKKPATLATGLRMLPVSK
jgi:hypothetical protein